MSLKRYEPDFAFNVKNGYDGMYEKENGKFVKFSDVEHLIEALKFYASGDHWHHTHPGSTTYSVVDGQDLGDGSFQLNEHTDDDKVGGKKAREALSTIGMGE